MGGQIWCARVSVNAKVDVEVEAAGRVCVWVEMGRVAECITPGFLARRVEVDVALVLSWPGTKVDVALASSWPRTDGNVALASSWPRADGNMALGLTWLAMMA